jgi:hypothetical protein
VKYPYYPLMGAYNQNSLNGAAKMPFQFFVTANIKI